ncbi:MAG: hypothetical protein AB7P40_19645 [Chloroflexota bacterium]
MLASGLHHHAWRIVLSIVFAGALATAPAELLSLPAAATLAATPCTTGPDVRATTCRLRSGQTVEGSLVGAAASATYRVDAVAAETTLELLLAGTGGSTRVVVTDWRGTELVAAARGDSAPDVRTSVTLPLPGAYGVTVTGDTPPEQPAFHLTAIIGAPDPPRQTVWPRGMSTDDGVLTGERQTVRTPRGGTPGGGVAVARALGSPPDTLAGDFVLVADVQFEEIVGPSAFTIRFRYEPEAGGGTGYLLSVDPFGGTVSLDSFEEGQRRPIVAHRPLETMPTSDAPNRIVLRADGPDISVTMDGSPILEATDSKYTEGLIAVGVVTWSEPAAVTFDHLQVSTVQEAAP